MFDFFEGIIYDINVKPKIQNYMAHAINYINSELELQNMTWAFEDVELRVSCW